MRRQLKIKLVGVVLLLGALGLIWWLFFGATPAPVVLPVRLTFVGFTNGVAAERMALFTLSNSASKPVLYTPVVLVEAVGNNGYVSFPPDKRTYERWVGNPPETVSVLAAGAATTFATTLPKSGSAWVEEVVWQSKPSKAQYSYAAALDLVLKFFHRSSYPSGMVPSSRIWQAVQITSDMLNARAEAGAVPLNGGPDAPVGSSALVEGRHR
jgi:hypothetical protein